MEDRRKEHKLILMYKMINNSSPQYRSSLVPPLVGEVSQYNLRNSRSLTLPRCRTKLYSDSFLPSTVRDWNDLPDEIKALPSINRFKKAIRHTQTKPPPYYYTGTRRLQVLHTRLRTGCSSLNSHLFSKNVIDSPLCLCGAAETVHHYFFVCPTYLNLRQILINSVSNIANPSINLFLYGEGTLTIEANTEIFQHVQSYIDQTKRFWVTSRLWAALLPGLIRSGLVCLGIFRSLLSSSISLIKIHYHHLFFSVLLLNWNMSKFLAA